MSSQSILNIKPKYFTSMVPPSFLIEVDTHSGYTNSNMFLLYLLFSKSYKIIVHHYESPCTGRI